MRHLLLLLVLACGGKQDAAPPVANVSTAPAPPPKTDEQQFLDRLAAARDEMCKCTAGDVGCSKRVVDDMTRWAENRPKQLKPMPEAEPILMELGECMKRVMMVPPDPNAGSGTP